MSSLSRSAFSTSGPPTTNTAAAAAAHPGLRLHASSDNLRSREAGPAAYEQQRIGGRRRSTLAGPDRKRRLVNLTQEGTAESSASSSSYARSFGGIGSSSRADMDSRPILSSSPHAHTVPDTVAGTSAGSSYDTAIDLSSSPIEAPSQPLQTRERRASSRSIHSQYGEQNRPSWQPDAEVTECPICRTAFSFWYRKHHCRKCGRVVCSSCSPHRITIPRQYIVHPPTSDRSGAASALAQRATHIVNLEGDDHLQSPVAVNPALGGGEEVRLCNPCVPDPNPEPPAGYSPVRPPGEVGSGSGWARHRSYHSISTPRQHPYASIPESFTSRPFRRTVGSSDYPGFAGFGGQYAPSFQGRPLSYGSSSSRPPPLPSSSRHTFHYPTSRSSDVPPVIPEPSSRPRAMHGSSQPSRHIDECDLCPICDNELPPLGPRGNEDDREAHIRNCIANHGRAVGGSPVSQPHIAVRMVGYTATEKDCIGHDGTEQECTICMEEYEVGQSLVRLECLCKFHKRCIAEWFERKKECPVHKTS
ncbi:FYVE zinc finger-domain-containing protein [Aspergillus venezuelensis]